MTSDICRATKCQYFGKFSGKACCRASKPKRYIKHLSHCPQTLRNDETRRTDV